MAAYLNADVLDPRFKMLSSLLGTSSSFYSCFPSFPRNISLFLKSLSAPINGYVTVEHLTNLLSWFGPFSASSEKGKESPFLQKVSQPQHPSTYKRRMWLIEIVAGQHMHATMVSWESLTRRNPWQACRQKGGNLPGAVEPEWARELRGGLCWETGRACQTIEGGPRRELNLHKYLRGQHPQQQHHPRRTTLPIPRQQVRWHPTSGGILHHSPTGQAQHTLCQRLFGSNRKDGHLLWLFTLNRNEFLMSCAPSCLQSSEWWADAAFYDLTHTK